MEAFNTIRAKARERRDKAIHQAKAEYEATLVKIAALEQDLLGREPSTHRTASNCINRVLPNDRAFTVADVVAGLEALDPGRVWRKRTVDGHISRLRERGVVKRLSKSKGLAPAVYVRVGVPVDAGPFGDKTLGEVAAEVLGGQSMTLTELAVAMLEAGYVTTMKPANLRQALSALMRTDGRFVRRGGKWASPR